MPQGKQEFVRDLVVEIRNLLKRLDASITTIMGAGYATEATLAVVENNTDGIEGLLTTIDADTNILANRDTNAGAATGNTLRVVIEDDASDAIDSIENNTSATTTRLNFANWDTIPGNSKVITWTTAAGNDVVDTIEYYSGASLSLTQTYSYDGNGNVTSIVAS